jgi:hypothetical protein
MAAGISRSALYGRVRRQLVNIGNRVWEAGGKAFYKNWELTGEIAGHAFRVYYGTVGPASNGESFHYPIYHIDGKCVTTGVLDNRSLLDRVAEITAKEV